MNKNLIKNTLTDVRFWLVFFFLIRLVGITNAPLEMGHSWRQAQTAMISRNFVEGGLHMLYPKIDMAGEKSGILGSEFPFLNFLIYLVSIIFGYAHWYGRLINLIISTAGIFFFYKLIQDLISRKVAFNATMVLLTSVWFGYSRKIMPDTFSVALVIIGLYFGLGYLKKGRISDLALFFLFPTLGLLSKIPALSLYSVIVIVPFIREIPNARKTALYAMATLSLALVGCWYFLWVPYLINTYHYTIIFQRGIMEGIREISHSLPATLEKFYFCSLQSFLAFICFLVGLVILVKGKNNRLKAALAVITIVFLIFAAKTGFVFPLHSYYIIPFAPLMALVAGIFLAGIPLKYTYILICLMAVEGIANQQHDFFIKKDQLYKLKLEELADKTIPKNDKVVINGGASPQEIYFLHRRGWTVNIESIDNELFIDSLQQLGAKYLVIDKNLSVIRENRYPLSYSDKNFAIYLLKSR
ncbi:MAG: glycosyltransferase family 39 protein [Bacteroidetes bacterium]|nr:glycosyltransferase family 39 protein [Bacteroidota bacterium]